MRSKIPLLLCCLGYLFFTLSVRGDNQRDGVVKIIDVKCQNRTAPVGIDESDPFFSWNLLSDERDVKQAAYQIVVASSPERLSNPDIWDSGKILSDQNTFIRYKGRPLQSAQQYYWEVKVWSNKNKKAEQSQTATFITGLFSQKEWRDAKWIAYNKLPDSMKVYPGISGSGDNLGNKAKKRAVIPCFRKDFEIKKQIKHAYAYVCGLGQYVLYINGQRTDSSLLNPTWSDYTKRCYYNAYDITSLLRNGENTIGSIVGTGFLYINRERYHKLIIAEGYPMLRLKLVIRFSDGTTKKITTDKSWKTALSAITYSSIYGGEDFDANKIQKGWKRPKFNDKNWRAPVIVPGPGGKMDAQEEYPIVINEKFSPIKIDSSKGNYRMYDFGQNVSGIVHLKASAPKGYTIRIIPAELINKDHMPDQRASGQPYYWQYTFDGKGIEDWQPLFSYYGFRYAGIKVFDPQGRPADINKVHLISLTSLHTQNGAPRVGRFSCSDTLFNKIFQLIRWGIRNNLSNVATDCPHREKLGWLEESHLMGNSIQYNYNILRFYSKIVKDMKDAQLSHGLVPDIAPEYVIFSDGFRDSPEWGSACVLDPWYVYQWYGDKSILSNSFSMMKKYLQHLRERSNHYLLAYGLGDWYDLGAKHPGVSQLTPLGLTATAFYYYDANIVSKIATLLHKPKEAKDYRSLADSIRNAFNQKYFNPGNKVYATGNQTSNAIPLYFGLVPEKYRKKILANLVDSIKKNNYALTAGDIGFRYVIQTLEMGGYNQVIYKMNNRSNVPGYGYQIKKGATALTESWQALRNVSNDHMMLGHLMEWFYSGLGGIRQQKGSVGYKKILVKPQFIEGISWVDCAYNSMNGQISVKWKRLRGRNIEVRITIPANVVSKVVLPHRVIEVGSGDYVFHCSPD